MDIERHAGRVIIKAPSSRQKWYMSTASVTMSMDSILSLSILIYGYSIWDNVDGHDQLRSFFDCGILSTNYRLIPTQH